VLEEVGKQFPGWDVWLGRSLFTAAIPEHGRSMQRNSRD
jgi:hypothetical protein